MMSLQSKLQKVETALAAINGLDVFHYWRPAPSTRYCIWQEYNEGISLDADNHKREQAVSGTVDLYTNVEYDPFADEIQEALNSIDVCRWEYEGSVFENETNLIHHSWTWTVA